jgi:elongator complex protein 3
MYKLVEKREEMGCCEKLHTANGINFILTFPYSISPLQLYTVIMIAQPASQAELHLLCVSAIVRDLITQHSSSSTPPNINTLRMKYAKKYNLQGVPRLTDVLAAVPEEWKERLRGWLTAKPVRTASGVAVVAVMCKPHRCPHVAMTGNICV